MVVSLFPGMARLSTDQVAPAEAVDYWQSVVGDTTAPVSLAPIEGFPFHGEIVPLVSTDAMSLMWSRCGGHVSTRNAGHIARADEQFVIVLIELPGALPRDMSELRPGTMSVFDTAHPMRLRLDRSRSLLVMRVRREVVVESATVGEALFGGPVIVTPQPSAQVISHFLTSLAHLAVTEPSNMPILAGHAPRLTAALIDLSLSVGVSEQAATVHLKEQVAQFLRVNFQDPDLTVDDIARACLVSRRTLFRVVGEDGVARRLRQLRLDFARRALLRHPEQSIAAIAAEAGFRNERTFYRAFQNEFSMTPREYRQSTACAV
ncbi:helix-turn-helix transcriptional regulator [Nocardia thailandica]|uniref:Helix-turn-helix transcriptional regulator n=1 Tax=Nocardia thailandica TaxID=257275 RepID=A0ABW6PTZ2_9NOCA